MDYHLLNSSNLFTKHTEPYPSSTSLLLPCHRHHLSSHITAATTSPPTALSCCRHHHSSPKPPPPPPLLPHPCRAAVRLLLQAAAATTSPLHRYLAPDRRFSLNHRRSASPVANGLDSTYSSSETAEVWSTSSATDVCRCGP
ncbi:hypothetical protein HanRHA438_Chr02g0093231 [Helianthus annuus]|uniref:uncharacterized protein LOC110927074 isoform X2 n=1 Tax=Helianthus annuus TaxID=4232 RepID=UPI000B8F2D4D|nr:uncharacterized protein LOC110927074 isoform X2 [Helianthus annuus]KAJ0941320.1 hypothetical protein HanRHA438_Chr02g0093231 [Helianthus annuus]